jgi:hypothetical protein
MSVSNWMKCEDCGKHMKECACEPDTSNVPEVSDEFFNNATVVHPLSGRKISSPSIQSLPTPKGTVTGRFEASNTAKSNQPKTNRLIIYDESASIDPEQYAKPVKGASEES